MKGMIKRGFRLERLRISGRKDWVIFWLFAGMIAYVAGGMMDYRLDEWLWGMADPWMTNLNVPLGYGRTMIAAGLLVVLGEAVLFFKKKPVKYKLWLLAAGLAVVLGAPALYRLHSSLIVSSLWKAEPESAAVWQDGEALGLKNQESGVLREEEYRTLLELCRSLEQITDPAEAEACMAWYKAEGDFVGADSVRLDFPERYGHHYVLNLRIKDGYIYLWRGYLWKEVQVTFFRDNGIAEWMEGL